MAGQGGFITITISGGDQLRVRARQLATWGMSVSSLEPAWVEVGEDLMADFARNMIRGGGFFGGGSKWAPLAPSTIREKQRLGYGAMPIMWRTGALAESLTDKGAAGNVFQAGADYVVVGSTLFYAKYHQFGSRKQKLRTTVTKVRGGYQLGAESVSMLPRRQLVGISWRRRSLIVRRLNAFVQEMARRAGLSSGGGGGGAGDMGGGEG